MSDEPIREPDRRRFLALGTAGAAAFLSACNSMGPDAAQRALKWFQRTNERLERGLIWRGGHDRVAAGRQPNGDDFPVYFVSDSLPMWDESALGVWSVELTGAVRRPMRLTLDELVELRRTSQTVNHYCVEGWNAVARWTGVRMADLARIVEPTPDAQYVDFESFDSGYHESWDIDSALHPQTLIAYALDGRFLGPRHGAPARLHSPIKLGYKSVKYLTRIVFTPVRTGGYWSDRGYEWYAGV